MNETILKEQTYDAELLVQVQSILEAGLSQKDLAKKIGYSAAAVSTYLKKEYGGDLIAFEHELKKYLKLENSIKKHKKIKLEFQKTSVASRIYNIAQICQLNSEIGLCFGSSGLGKTTAIKNYALNHSGVIIIDPDERISLRALLSQIALPLKLRTENNMMPDLLIAEIVKRLNKSGYLIIVDEAENLSASCFRTLRKIHDRCEFTFGLLFMGTEKLCANLTRMHGEYAYVTNRIAYTDSLDVLTRSDIQLLASQIFPNATEANLRAFELNCGRNARILFNLLKRTKDILESTKDDLNPQMIEAAKKLLLC